MRKKDELKALGIRNSVIKLTRDYGFQGITMSRIAKDCGISSSSIYTYYTDKREMIHSIYHDIREKCHKSIYSSVEERMDAEETLRVIYLDYFDYIMNHEEEYYYVRQFSSCQFLEDEARRREYYMTVENLISRFIKTREVVNVDSAIIHAMMFSTIERIAEYNFISGNTISEDEIIISFNMIWRGIKAQ